MSRFGYLAVEKFGYVKKKDLIFAINKQWKQDWQRHGTSDPVGKILVDEGLITEEQRDAVLEAMLMEPSISWGEETRFAENLKVEKFAKQALGEYVGERMAKQPTGITVFLSNSTTIYYAFRGMVKHRADVNVITIHAAILAVYPSLKSKIRSVRTVWKGRVDLDNALIEPDDPDAPSTRLELGFLDGEATHALISATGFDCKYGPMADNATAREVSRLALQSETHTCVLIDHTKIRIGTEKSEPGLLFRGKEWEKIRGRGDMEVVVTCHPHMPQEQASFEPAVRSCSEIEKIMLAQNAPQSTIKEVLRYQEWSMKVRDILREVPFGG